MIVVSNTSPLTNLAAIGQFHILHTLYDQLYIADGVWAELNANHKAWPGSKEVSNANWIEKRSVQNLQTVIALRRDLDKGEAETIALAIELEADLVLLDEQDGRFAAKRFGLKVVGVIGLLLEAKHKKQILEIRTHLDALKQQAGFHIHDNLFQQAIKLANE